MEAPSIMCQYIEAPSAAFCDAKVLLPDDASEFVEPRTPQCDVSGRAILAVIKILRLGER